MTRQRMAAPATSRAGIGVGRAFGTFGELLQGVLPENDQEFQVTFPIDAWTTTTFEYLSDRADLTVFPRGKTKALRLARSVLDALDQPGGGVLRISSELPEGKGLASSSADLVATLRAVAEAFDITPSTDSIERFLRAMEPSDGVMHDGVVVFHHREVRLRDHLAGLPPLAVLAHDEGGQIDTIAHNRVPKPYDDADKRTYDTLLRRITEAVRAGDVREVGRVSTCSSRMNLKVRSRQNFTELSRLCDDVDGLGLVATHSGTMLGVLLLTDDPELTPKLELVRERCRPLGGDVSVHRSLSHGCRRSTDAVR